MSRTLEDLIPLLKDLYQYLPGPQSPNILTPQQLSNDLKRFDEKFQAVLKDCEQIQIGVNSKLAKKELGILHPESITRCSFLEINWKSKLDNPELEVKVMFKCNPEVSKEKVVILFDYDQFEAIFREKVIEKIIIPEFPNFDLDEIFPKDLSDIDLKTKERIQSKLAKWSFVGSVFDHTLEKPELEIVVILKCYPKVSNTDGVILIDPDEISHILETSAKSVCGDYNEFYFDWSVD
jgi:hypothetical protein